MGGSAGDLPAICHAACGCAYWNAARLIPRVKQVLEARPFKIGYELGRFKFDRLPPDVTVNHLAINGRVADLTGTLGSVTESLVVEIDK